MRTIGHDDVVLALAWVVFHTAFGARTLEEQKDIILELCTLVKAEFEIGTRFPRGLPNDGKRALGILRRVIEGGPQFWNGFDHAAQHQAELLIAELAVQAPTPGQTELANTLIKQLLETQRHQSWNDEYTVNWRTRIIGPGTAAWQVRETLLRQIQGALESDSTPHSSRLVFWGLLVDSHRSINQIRTNGSTEIQQCFRDILLDNLKWALNVISSRRGNIRELSAARELWNWHHQFEEDSEIRDLSVKLESQYASNEFAEEFEELLCFDNVETFQSRAASKADQLVANDNPNDIDAFILRAIQYLGGDGNLGRLGTIAVELGTRAISSSAVRSYVLRTLGSANVSPVTQFAVAIASQWVFTLRKSGEISRIRALLQELMNACGSEAQVIYLVSAVYSKFTIPTTSTDFTRDELDELVSLGPLFLRNGQGPAFIGALGPMLRHDWTAVRVIVEEYLSKIPSNQVSRAVQSLVDTMYWIVREKVPEGAPTDLGLWMLNQLLVVSDLDELGGNLEWYISEILKRLGRAPLSWLSSALTTRMNLKSQHGRGTYHAVGHSLRLGEYVTEINANNANAAETATATSALLDLAVDAGSVGYYLPELVRDIDPSGLVVPAELARRVSRSSSTEDLYRLARLGGAYVIGAPAWRTVAKAILVEAALRNPEERQSLSARSPTMGSSRGRISLVKYHSSLLTNSNRRCDSSMMKATMTSASSGRGGCKSSKQSFVNKRKKQRRSEANEDVTGANGGSLEDFGYDSRCGSQTWLDNAGRIAANLNTILHAEAQLDTWKRRLRLDSWREMLSNDIENQANLRNRVDYNGTSVEIRIARMLLVQSYISVTHVPSAVSLVSSLNGPAFCPRSQLLNSTNPPQLCSILWQTAGRMAYHQRYMNPLKRNMVGVSVTYAIRKYFTHDKGIRRIVTSSLARRQHPPFEFPTTNGIRFCRKSGAQVRCERYLVSGEIRKMISG